MPDLNFWKQPPGLDLPTGWSKSLTLPDRVQNLKHYIICQTTLSSPSLFSVHDVHIDRRAETADPKVILTLGRGRNTDVQPAATRVHKGMLLVVCVCIPKFSSAVLAADEGYFCREAVMFIYCSNGNWWWRKWTKTSCQTCNLTHKTSQ